MESEVPRLVLLTGLGVTPFLVEPLRRRIPLAVETPAWIDPLPDESLPHYSARMAQRIGPADNLYLAGVSFGAVVALEASKLLRPRGVILIGGGYSWRDLSLELRLVFRLAQVAPDWLVRAGLKIAPLGLRYFGPLNREDWRFFRELLRRHVRIDFGRWAARKMLNWEFHGPAPCPVYHIHGGNDRPVPLRPIVRPDRIIPGGGHVIHVHDADQVADFVLACVGSEPRRQETHEANKPHIGSSLIVSS